MAPHPSRALATVALLVLALALGGCTSSDAGSTPGRVADPGPDDDDVRREDTVPAPSPGPRDATPTTADGARMYGPPTWAPGDWWAWEVHGGGSTLETTTVVAETDDDVATLGFATLEQGLIAQWFHLPPAGPTSLDTLAWTLHGDEGRLLRFPIHDGASWTTTFEGMELDVTATANASFDAPVFTIEALDDEGRPGVLALYDAGLGQFRHVALHYGAERPWATADMVEHGRGHRAPVHVVHAEDLFLGGSAAPSWLETPQRLVVPEHATHLLMGCELGGRQGLYAAHLQGPDGREATCQHQEVSAEWSVETQVRTLEAAAGEWTLVFAPAGDGFVFTEVAALSVRTVGLT